MSRIVFVAPPFGGHLHPILALARRAARDHDTIVFSSAGARGRIEAAGVPAAVSHTANDDAIEAIVRGARATKNDPFALARQLRGNIALMERFRDEFGAFCDRFGPELVIADFAAPVAGFVARERGIAWWTSHPSPSAIETPDGPPAYCGGWRPLAGPAGAARDRLGRLAVRTVKTALHARFAASLRSLGLCGIYRADGTERIYSPDRILALGYSELEFARRYPASVRFIGPAFFVPERIGGDPIERGAGANVLVTIGTQAPWFADTMASAVQRAAATNPTIRFVMTAGELDATPDARGEARAPNFVRVPFVRYETDLGRYDLVVHHGGTGIANAALAAGIPALVFPLDYDQFDVAARLTAGGYARRVRRLDRLDADVRAALHAPELRAAAGAFARDVAPRYDAPETTAELIAEFSRHRARERSAATDP